MYKHKFNIFPEMNSDEFKMLLNELELNGYDKKQPIWLYQGEILDGWNRFRACQQLKIKPEFADFDGTDIEAISFVMRTNKRRNLNSSQWAVIALKSKEIIYLIKEEIEEQRKRKISTTQLGNKSASKKQTKTILSSSVSKSQSQTSAEVVADLFNTSATYIKDASYIQETKPEALADIESGKKSISEVKKEIKIEQQKKAILKNVVVDVDNKIENTDALTFLKSLPDSSVSMVLTDPPFGIDYVDTRDVGREKFNDEKESTLKLIDEVCFELQRVCKNNTHLYFFSGYTNLYQFQTIISKYFTLQENPLIWVKNNHTMCNFAKQWANMYEFIIFATKGTERPLNYRVSQDVLTFAKPTNKIHSCEKPIDLLEYIINNSSYPSEVILDPFGGSLSTYKAAIKNDRKCYTCELNPEIYKLAMNNL